MIAVKRLVLDLDSRYDLILGMAGLERREPWINWRSKTLDATSPVPKKASKSHEPTSARKQKRFWREKRTESVSVLDIGMSELVDSDDVQNISREPRSLTFCGTAHIPSSNTHCDNESLMSKAKSQVIMSEAAWSGT